jgi:putative ABC transport system ATP-binding protein
VSRPNKSIADEIVIAREGDRLLDTARFGSSISKCKPACRNGSLHPDAARLLLLRAVCEDLRLPAPPVCALRRAGAMLVRLEDVERIYRMGEVELHALRKITLEIDRGEMVAVMGASGSGKSTLLNVVGTLDRPSAGRYLLDEESTVGLDEFELSELRNRKIGFVFQSFNLLPRYSAVENVELPMIYKGESPSMRRKKALAALSRVGLEERIDHLPTELSGGQQQRVAIARAIVNQPLLLLADEPTGALDSATTAQVMDLFCELHREGMTVVLVTHDPNIAAFAERVVTFKDGEILSDQRKVQDGLHLADPAGFD